MDKKKANRYDAQIAELSRLHKRIDKVDMLLANPGLKDIHLAQLLIGDELNNMVELYRDYLIPAARELGKEKEKDANESKFKDGLDIELYATEDVDEVVRLGYVHLWNKYEAFKNKIIARMDVIFDDAVSIEDYINAEYKTRIHEAHILHPKLEEVDWVNNSVKHNDGVPLQRNDNTPHPERFRKADQINPLQISPEELYADIIEVRNFTPHLFLALTAVFGRRLLERQCDDWFFKLLPAAHQRIVREDRDKAIAEADRLMKEMLAHQPKMKYTRGDRKRNRKERATKTERR